MHISFLDASSPFGNHQLNLHNESLKKKDATLGKRGEKEWLLPKPLQAWLSS